MQVLKANKFPTVDSFQTAESKPAQCAHSQCTLLQLFHQEPE